MAGAMDTLNSLARRVPVWPVYLLLALPITAAVVIVARELVLPALKDWAENRGATS